jgi:hypothetical protein
MNSAVAFIVFNRPEETAAVFESIRAARPRKLFLIADAPRLHVPGEDQLCQAARAVINAIDWPCEVFRNYADRNLGCADRVISGLNWAFEKVDELIILEDDCLPAGTFFPFCQEVLAKYRDDDRIAMVSGTNSVDAPELNDSYYFSQAFYIWGWATWKSKWAKYDRNITSWPQARREGILEVTLDEPRAVAYWTSIFDRMYHGVGPNTWDYQWHYTCLVNNWLSVVPKTNLISNIGFGPTATHTTDRYAFAANRAIADLELPLTHPHFVLPRRDRDRRTQQVMFVPGIGTRIRRKLSKARAMLLESRDIESTVPHSNRFSDEHVHHAGCNQVRASSQRPQVGESE